MWVLPRGPHLPHSHRPDRVSLGAHHGDSQEEGIEPMAQSNEEKAAKKIIAAIDSHGINPAMVLFAITGEAVNAQQHELFKLVCCLIKHWAESDPLSTHYAPTVEDMERKFLSVAMRDALVR